MKKAFFCDSYGRDCLGSDAMAYIDGRWSVKTIGLKMVEYYRIGAGIYSINS